MIKTPYSALALDDQSIDDFPSVLHWWKCDETSGSSIACAKTGVTLTPTAAAVTFGAASNSIRAVGGQSNLVATTSAALSAPSKNNVLLMVVTSALTADDGFAVQIGTTTAGKHAILLDDSLGPINVVAGNVVATQVAATKASINAAESQAVVAKWNGSNSMDASVFHDATVVASGGADAVGSTAITSLGSTLQVVCGGSVNVDIYGILALELTSAPSNAFVTAMLNWHKWAWKNGYKKLYPGLKGLA